jgi:hypothetical protein
VFIFEISLLPFTIEQRKYVICFYEPFQLT